MTLLIDLIQRSFSQVRVTYGDMSYVHFTCKKCGWTLLFQNDAEAQKWIGEVKTLPSGLKKWLITHSVC